MSYPQNIKFTEDHKEFFEKGTGLGFDEFIGIEDMYKLVKEYDAFHQTKTDQFEPIKKKFPFKKIIEVFF